MTIGFAIIIAVAGFLAGGISVGLFALHLQRHRWRNRYRPHRYEEIL